MPVIAPKRKMAQENFTEDENHKTVQELYCSAEFVRGVESKLIFLSALNIFFSSLHFWETFWFSDSSWYQYIGTALGLVTTIFAYAKIFVTLRHNQIHVQNHAAQGQPSQTIPLNIARYRKVVYSALWVQGTLVICYLPYVIVVALQPQRGMSLSIYRAQQFTATLLYSNSSLNPLLYCWKIREVRQAVKVTLKQLFCRSS